MEGIHDFQPPLCAFPGCGKPEDDYAHHIARTLSTGTITNHLFQEGVDASLPLSDRLAKKFGMEEYVAATNEQIAAESKAIAAQAAPRDEQDLVVFDGDLRTAMRNARAFAGALGDDYAHIDNDIRLRADDLWILCKAIDTLAASLAKPERSDAPQSPESTT
jgi:hypothetical protein